MTKKKARKPKSVPVPVRSSKEEKLFQNILRTTQQFIQGKGFTQMSEHELLQRLCFPPQHAPIFHEVLQNLVHQGIVELSKGQYRSKRKPIDVVTGLLFVHPRGFGFLQPDDAVAFPEDIFIPKHLTMNAIDGDRVEVNVNTQVVTEKGPEGRVVNIVSRGRTQVAGIIRTIEKNGTILAHVPLLGESQRVVVQPSKERELGVGDRIIMKVLEWGEKASETTCEMADYLGHISDPSCDIKASIAEFELRERFPRRVVEEAKAYGTRVSIADIRNREDLREMECFTIDPETAKDFDDALTLSKDDLGHYHLGVHIADVSHYVHPGSALDDEAQLRCNSTYFPGYCLPMLPSELSDNLCSLKPNVNRLTVSVLVDFDSSGNMLHYRIARSVIQSAKRFSYKEAKEVLDGKVRSKHLPTLQLMVELCGLLKRQRYQRGSIEFSIPELIIKVNKEGVPTGTEYVEYDITHQLVEEFMLKANELVALHLSKQGKNLTYRIHEEPAEENLRDFALLVGAFGFHLPEKPTPAQIQQLFDEALSTPYGPYLATSYIRRMRLAIYSPDNVGHYGLSLTHYCHFTSPIRRYVDLVAHRILFGESDDRHELEQISHRASSQERMSAKAESSVLLLKKLRLLDEIYKKEPFKQFEAVVARLKPFGLFFEVLDFMIEGFVHISELGDDYYIFEEDKMRFRGRGTDQIFSAGDKITVMLKDIDLILLQTNWSLVAGAERAPKVHEIERKRPRWEKFDKFEKKPTRETSSREERRVIIDKPLPSSAKPLPSSSRRPFASSRQPPKSRSSLPAPRFARGKAPTKRKPSKHSPRKKKR